MESGEGIESEEQNAAWFHAQIVVESGEGIESRRGRERRARNSITWNPVKELKAIFTSAFPRTMRP